MALLLPRTKRLEELDDFVALALTYVIDANRAHLDIVVEQKVEQAEQPLKRVVIGTTGKRAIRDGVTPQTLNCFCDPEELKPATDGAFRGYLQRARQMIICPVDEVRLYGWVLFMRQR